MKLKLKSLLLVAFISITLSACTDIDEVRYSCDDSINEWVVGNIEKVHKMSRAAWLEMEPDKGLACYRAFTPDQKEKFWKDKFAEVKTLDWSEAEIEHIEKLEAFVFGQKDFFTKEITDSELDELDEFCYEWQNEAIAYLGWNVRTVRGIAMTGYTLADKDGNVNVKYRSGQQPPGGGTGPTPPPTQPGTEPRCNCNLKNDFCNAAAPYYERCLTRTKCTELSWGCGWILKDHCDGYCDPDIY